MTLGAHSLVTTRAAMPRDAALLATLAATTFSDSFAADNTPEDMALYMAGAFGESIQHAELSDPRNIVFLAEQNGEAVGYAMLHQGPAPDVVSGVDPIEIARLYATKRWIGAGIGAALMQRCLDEAAARDQRTIWLGVWEHNARAIAFYRRWGFVDIGAQPFMLGRDMQTDRVMARRVAEER